MGSGIAEVASRAGYEVILRSRKQESADATLAKMDSNLKRAVDKGRLSEEDHAAILGRVTATADLSAVADCDLVIESVVEDLATKSALFTELDQVCGPDTILATNTSTLAVTELAVATGRPDKVCGIHFQPPRRR